MILAFQSLIVEKNTAPTKMQTSKKEIIQLRTAKLEDLAAIQQLFVDAVRTICKKDYTTEQINVWASAAENTSRWSYKIETQYFLVAEIADEIVGFASLENGAYFDLLYVHKDHLRKGIANSLYQAIETASKERGSATITADVSITARHLLERKGYQLIQENKNTIHGVEIINFKMTKTFYSL